MRRISFFVAGLILAATLFVVNERTVVAGRIGGGGSWVVNVAGNQAVSYLIPFAANDTAVISVVGSSVSNLNLVVTDGDGNTWTGTGTGADKTVRINVVREGTFRVTVQNLGPAVNQCIIGTN